MQELFELVRDELEKAGCLDKIPAGVVLSGGGSQLAGCADVARHVMNCPVRLGKPQGVERLEKWQDPRYSTAVGLLLYGAKRHRAALQRIEKNPPKGSMHWWRKIMDNFLNRIGR